MWIEKVLGSRAASAAELTARFAERRHELLAENVANLDTPDYQTRRLDVDAFRAALREAVRDAAARGRTALELRGHRQFWTDRRGVLQVRPTTEPAQNVLFHDGTNARLETLLADVQKNALDYNLAIQLLRGRFNTLLRATRGRTT